MTFNVSVEQLCVLAGLVVVGCILYITREVSRWGDVRKESLELVKTCAEALKVPVEIAKLTQQHLHEISVIAQGAMLGNDVLQLEKLKREQMKALEATRVPPKESGTVEVKGPETFAPTPAQPATVPVDPLFGTGANGGVPVEVKGRVEMSDGTG
jgi:hypothetical protein